MAIVSLVSISLLLLVEMSHGGFVLIHHHRPHRALANEEIVRRSTVANGDVILIGRDHLPTRSEACSETSVPLVSLDLTEEHSMPPSQRKHVLVPQWAKRLWLRRWRPWFPRIVPDTPKVDSGLLFSNVPSPVSVGHWLFCCMKQHPEVCMVHIMLVLGAAEVAAGMGLGPFREDVP